MNKALFFILFVFSLSFMKAQDEDYMEDSLYTTGHYHNMLPADSVLKKNPVSEK
ncbi:hypothetical protein [Chryseobacterium capnotolerans]|uniref:hypothetical protein n=1 Tax=Chryseobacterium capnotolerans TaxID=2759528 RepID=UPI001E62E4F6|nr:hypothetical protein [Chryseobacterium capnotolerans]